MSPWTFLPQTGSPRTTGQYRLRYPPPDTETFSSRHEPAHAKGIPVGAYDSPLIPIYVDPPMVQEYWRVLLSCFSPGAAREDESRQTRSPSVIP